MDIGLRVSAGSLYRPVLAKVMGRTYNTHAYDSLCSVEEYAMLTQQSEDAVRLSTPPLVKDRHVFAFRNGVYVADMDLFYPFQPTTVIPAHLVAAKYFDADLAIPPEGTPWRDIPTPYLDTIQDQGARDWLLVMVGRLLYEQGSLDNWQVTPLLHGPGATSLLDVLTQLYEPVDVADVFQGMKDKFGLSKMMDKYMFQVPDAGFALTNAEFQQLVSGEEVLVCRRFKTDEVAWWKQPGVLVSNSLEAGVGSIAGHIIPFCCDQVVGTELAGELPVILLKANRAYRAAVSWVGKESSWGHLPVEIVERHQRILNGA